MSHILNATPTPAAQDDHLDLEPGFAAFGRLYIAHPTAQAIVTRIQNLAARAPDPGREPVSAVLTGHPGAGKTTVCREVLRSMPEILEDTEAGITHVVPAFYCAVPASGSVKALVAVMLASLGVDDPTRGDVAALEYRLHRVLVTCRTRLILLDEFQHLLDRAAERTRTVICNWVKDLMNRTGIPVVIVGMPECEQLVNGNPQLARRFPYRLHLESFPCELTGKGQFRPVLKAFRRAITQHFAFQSVLPLTDADQAERLFVATQGNMGALSRLLQMAIEQAVLAGATEFTAEHLRHAYDLAPPFTTLLRPGLNPFMLSQADIQTVLATRP